MKVSLTPRGVHQRGLFSGRACNAQAKNQSAAGLALRSASPYRGDRIRKLPCRGEQGASEGQMEVVKMIEKKPARPLSRCLIYQSSAAVRRWRIPLPRPVEGWPDG